MVETAIGGKTVTELLDGEKRFAIVARFSPESRSNVETIRDIAVSTPDGQRIPLAQLADISMQRGASMIYREANQRFIAIKFGVRGRDIGGAVQEAQAKVKRDVKLPPGYHTVWGGEFESMQRAQARLMLIVPVTLLLIFLVLFMLFNAVSRAAIVMATIPFAVVGGVVALCMTHFHLSVSAAVGFIALFGVAVQNRVSHGHLLRSTASYGPPVSARGRDPGAVTRLRPVLMTALLATIGLLPAAVSTGIGSDLQKPLAIVIIGGLILDVITGTIFVLPVLYSLLAKPVLDTETELASM